MANSALTAALQVLEMAGEPLHYREITKRMLSSGLWASEGRTPEATVNARLASNIKHKGSSSLFTRHGKGIFGLRSWSDGNNFPRTKQQHPEEIRESVKENSSLSFTAAAEKILRDFGNKQPLHYREITAKALAQGLLNTSGKTPEATMYAQIITEIRRYTKKGKQPRFVMHGKGLVSLASWQPRGLPFEIDQHNKKIRQALHKRLLEMEATTFEELISRLLAEMGFCKGPQFFGHI